MCVWGEMRPFSYIVTAFEEQSLKNLAAMLAARERGTLHMLEPSVEFTGRVS